MTCKGITHHLGCDCSEAAWQKRLDALAQQNLHLRSALEAIQRQYPVGYETRVVEIANIALTPPTPELAKAWAGLEEAVYVVWCLSNIQSITRLGIALDRLAKARGAV